MNSNSNEDQKSIKKENNCVQKLSDFSIDHILNRAGSKTCQNELNFNDKYRKKSQEYVMHDTPVFDWLYYTRYHPPRLPRNGSNPLKQPAKRTPGRLPRVPFTPEQLKALESAYKKSMYLSSEEANILANQLDLSSIRVKIWFQNRRARDRRENRIDIVNFTQKMQHEKSWSDEERISFNF